MLREDLTAARQASDAALAALQAAFEHDPRLASSDLKSKLYTVRQAIAGTRSMVDEIGAQAPDKRLYDYVASAVAGQVDLTPRMVKLTGELASIADSTDPALRDGLEAAREAASLCEYAGQLASRLTAALITHRKLSHDEVIEIGRLYGRIELLRSLLRAQMKGYLQPPELRRALDEVDKQYFEGGYQFFEYLLRVGLTSGDYGITPHDLIQRYFPSLQSISALRDVILDDLLHQAERRNRQARNFLVTVVALTVLACLFFQLLMVLIRRRVVRPLVTATDLVVGLAEGKVDCTIPPARYRDEVGDMLRALIVLKAHILERNSLAREREVLITQLQVSSSTDFLTGMLNRRAFFEHGRQQMAAAQRYGRELSLILFDIDHFKRINDTYGHQAGDEVLRGTARLVSTLLRKVDVLARYGGEEFIILLSESDAQQATAVAQKLRVALEGMGFALDDGRVITISASFGVSGRDQGRSLEDMIRLADRALYAAKGGGRNRVESAA